MLRTKKLLPDVQEAAVPDSTTTLEKDQHQYTLGQDVFFIHNDGRYYLGSVVEVDHTREKCLVKFGDNTESWSNFKDLAKLRTPEEEDLFCVVCKKSSPKSRNEIVNCDKCGRGYHQSCHKPEITLLQKRDSSWLCKRCLEQISTREEKLTPVGIIKSAKKSLPYDVNTLTWDTYHRENQEHIYCYCGQNGEWYSQMLQCSKCRQWFHEKCVNCLRYPLYCGDRFYVFVCSICNHGKEFLRRLEMKWVDLVHLMLFNLTAFNSKKYYDLDTVIVPYINDNWHALQLPPKIYNVSKAERRDNILSVLTNNRNRFKCGREIKKKTTIWGLRVRLPPPAHCVNLPKAGSITEKDLREHWQGNRRLQFLPLSESSEEPSKNGYCQKVVEVDSQMMNIMMGIAYQEHNAYSENDSPSQSPEREQTQRPEEARVKMYQTMIYQNKLQLKKKYVERLESSKKKENFRGQKSASPASCNSTIELNTSDLENKNVEKNMETSSGDETSSKSTLDLIIPPPKDFKGQNNPFLTLFNGTLVTEGRKNKRKKDSITLPLPLTAVIPGKPVVRPMKRKLSEKDICIGPNGEVKRKRLRRNRSNHIFPPCGTASKTAAIIPAKPDNLNHKNFKNINANSNQIGKCVDYALNGRRLRQRQDKTVEKEKPLSSPTPKVSPSKQEAEINLDDLKNSVNSYFGAATRIAAGERFNVRAKRIGPSGKIQYLIEWEGLGNGMT